MCEHSFFRQIWKRYQKLVFGVRNIEDAYGGSSPHSYTVCVCDYSRSRGRHKCRHPRKTKSAYLQNMHICKSCVSAQPAYLQNLTENLRKQDRTSSKNHRILMILEVWGALGQTLPKSSKKYAKCCLELSPFGNPFSTIIANMWASKYRLFFGPCIFVPNSVRGPPK